MLVNTTNHSSCSNVICDMSKSSSFEPKFTVFENLSFAEKLLVNMFVSCNCKPPNCVNHKGIHSPQPCYDTSPHSVAQRPLFFEVQLNIQI
jgi:hypothetical protein